MGLGYAWPGGCLSVYLYIFMYLNTLYKYKPELCIFSRSPGGATNARVKFDETCLKRLFEESFDETINDLNYLWVTLLMASRGHLFEDTCV